MIVAQRITAQKRIAEELRLARYQEENTAIEIQKTLLNSPPPQEKGTVDFGLRSSPSLLVDGDFTDFLPMNDSIVDIVLGDVMGKGIPAALIGAATKETFLRVVTGLLSRSPGKIPPVEKIVEELRREISPRLNQLAVFVTMAYVRIDLERQLLFLFNAGHPPILHLHADSDEVTSYHSVAPPLGLMSGQFGPPQCTGFSWKDRVLVYSDGVCDTRNDQGEFFGGLRLRETFVQNRGMRAQPLADRIFFEVQRFANVPQMQDDFTCIVVDLHGGKTMLTFKEMVEMALKSKEL